MTFDLYLWPLTSWTCTSSYIISINQVPIRLPLLEWGHISHFQLTTWPQMTFDLDVQPLTSSANAFSHVASGTQLWLKSIKACGSQMLTCSHNSNRQHCTNSDPYASFLLSKKNKADDTKIACSDHHSWYLYCLLHLIPDMKWKFAMTLLQKQFTERFSHNLMQKSSNSCKTGFSD